MLNSIITYKIIIYEYVMVIPKYNWVSLGQLPLIKYYIPLSFIIFLPIYKIKKILKFNCSRLDQLPLIKY